MSLITNPALLLSGNSLSADQPGPELTLDLVNLTFTLNPGQGDLTLPSSGVTGQALYSAFKRLWNNNADLPKIPFPMEPITPEQFEFIRGWRPADDTTRKALRTCGWVERSSTGETLRVYSGIISLGTLGSTDQPYYQYSSNGAPVNFTFTGPVNEAIQVFGNIDNGNFDRRNFLRVFVREPQKTYSSSSLTDIGASSLTSIVYRFPLTSAADTKIAVTDNDITTNTATYGNIDATFYAVDQVRSIGGSNYNFRIIIDGDNKTAEQIYAKVQYLLRQDSDIDAGAGAVNGKTADSLLRFVGDTLITGQGVYIDNYNSNDVNRITFTDTTNTPRTFPFLAAGTFVFSSTLVDDPSARYSVFFRTTPTGSFGQTNAIFVNDSLGNPITGTVSSETIPFTFNYDSNNQGGRTPGTDAQIVVVASGLETGQYTVANATITRTTGQNITITAPLERTYID